MACQLSSEDTLSCTRVLAVPRLMFHRGPCSTNHLRGDYMVEQNGTLCAEINEKKPIRSPPFISFVQNSYQAVTLYTHGGCTVHKTASNFLFFQWATWDKRTKILNAYFMLCNNVSNVCFSNILYSTLLCGKLVDKHSTRLTAIDNERFPCFLIFLLPSSHDLI